MRNGVSARAYFIGVAVVSALLLALAMALRPSFAYAVRDTFGLVQPVPAAPDSFYTTRVAPLFAEHCTGCHGGKRQKGDLRLDELAAVMRGGKHGPVIRAGSAGESELVARIGLPQTDPKAMPPQGKEPLSGDDVAVVRAWIAAGASATRLARDIAGAPPPVRKIEIPVLDTATAARERAAFAAPLADLQARYPGAIAFVSRSSADLEINASRLGASFDDGDLAALEPLRDRIVRLDVSGTRVGDASGPALAAMHRLQVLRALDTGMSAKSLAPLRDRGTKVHDGRF